MNNTGQGNQRRENNNEDRPGWGGIIAAGAVAVGGIYLLSKIFGGSSENENEGEIPSRRSMYETRRSFEEQDSYTRQGQPRHTGVTSTNPFRNSPGNKGRILIVIDATPEKCGGFVVFTKERQIEYYSTTWSPCYKFPTMQGESDKFEMTNALVAMMAFDNVIQGRMSAYEGVTIKTDNSFFKSTYKNNEHSILRNEIKSMEGDLNSEWEQVTTQDPDMKIADYLSRSKNYNSIMNDKYPGYLLQEINVENALYMIKHIVPSKYHVLK